MGDMISRWWWGGDPDEKNEISGMSLRDIYNVQQSWKSIYANAGGNGFLMFYRLFLAEPSSKTFFRNVAHIESEAEMAANVSFRAHVINIMSSFNMSIQNLNKPELVTVWMQKLGDSHQQRKIEKKYFLVFKDVLVNIFRNDLKLNDDVVESWGRYIDFIYKHIFSRLVS